MDKPYKRADSPYWWVKLPPIPGERKPLQTSTRTTDYLEACQFLEHLRSERWRQASLGQRPRRTWAEAVGKYIAETSHKRSHSKDLAIITWLHPRFGDLYLDEISREVVDSVKAERLKHGSKSTANRYLALIRAVLNKVRDDWEWLDKVPKVRLFPEPKGRVRWLTQAEFVRLHTELPPHLADMALFTVMTGLRQSNVSRLEWSQVNLSLRHVYIPPEKFKTGVAHSVPLNDGAMGVLMAQVGKNKQYVFTYQGKPVANVSTKAWWAALERAGIKDFRWHDLRHTFAVWQREAGTPTHELQQLGGWASLSMVERYAHVAPRTLQEAAARVHNPLRMGYDLAEGPKGTSGRQ